MSLFSTNRCKSLSAEYVEEQVKIQEAENKIDKVEASEDAKITEEPKSEVENTKDIEDFSDEKDFVSEAAYIDALLEALE